MYNKDGEKIISTKNLYLCEVRYIEDIMKLDKYGSVRYIYSDDKYYILARKKIDGYYDIFNNLKYQSYSHSNKYAWCVRDNPIAITTSKKYITYREASDILQNYEAFLLELAEDRNVKRKMLVRNNII